MSEKITFETVLEKHENMEATGITIPFDVYEVFGAKRVPVKIVINNAVNRSTVVKMNGRYCLVIPKHFRESAGIRASEKITVTLEKDDEPRIVEIPADFAAALEKNNLTEVFRRMSFTHQKEYAVSVSDAKKPETRLRRIEKNIGMLASKSKT
jgi:bifunctional DNA-binding transcriptional regulator/antitoxin component of YhaV-PrlF toxin-antitoxin module